MRLAFFNVRYDEAPLCITTVVVLFPILPLFLLLFLLHFLYPFFFFRSIPR